MTPGDLEWIRTEFERCKPWIQAALDKSLGEYAIEHVWQFLETGAAQIWPTPNACMVTLVETYPTGLKMLKGWLSGGDLSEIVRTEPNIRAWGRGIGCNLVVIGGRPGWVRAFEGYRSAYSVIVRDLNVQGA